MTARSGIVITGPTGIGKTGLSIRLAELLLSENSRAHIVSADSLSIYRELEIGTAKPSRADRARVPHHLIDVRSIADHRDGRPAYSAGDFARDFFNLMPNLPDPVMIVGGTGFYIDAAVRGLADNPRPDPELRRALMAEENRRPGSLFDRLRRIDPSAADKIGPHNLPRLVRAIEVVETAGGKFFERPRIPSNFSPVVFVLTAPPDDIYRAIDERTRRMFSEGILDEVESILRTFPADLPALSSIGYTEAVAVVKGVMTREQAIERTSQRTRQLVKRQLTWWRHFRYEKVCVVPSGVSPRELLRRCREVFA